jgi:hypothetical protein
LRLLTYRATTFTCSSVSPVIGSCSPLCLRAKPWHLHLNFIPFRRGPIFPSAVGPWHTAHLDLYTDRPSCDHVKEENNTSAADVRTQERRKYIVTSVAVVNSAPAESERAAHFRLAYQLVHDFRISCDHRSVYKYSLALIFSWSTRCAETRRSLNNNAALNAELTVIVQYMTEPEMLTTRWRTWITAAPERSVRSPTASANLPSHVAGGVLRDRFSQKALHQSGRAAGRPGSMVGRVQPDAPTLGQVLLRQDTDGSFLLSLA